VCRGNEAMERLRSKRGIGTGPLIVSGAPNANNHINVDAPKKKGWNIGGKIE